MRAGSRRASRFGRGEGDGGKGADDGLGVEEVAFQFGEVHGDDLLGGELQLFDNGFFAAAGHLAAVAEDGEDQSMDELAQGDAGVGVVMEGGGGLGVEKLDLDVELEFARPGLEDGHVIVLLDKDNGVGLEAEGGFDAQLLDDVEGRLGSDGGGDSGMLGVALDDEEGGERTGGGNGGGMGGDKNAFAFGFVAQELEEAHLGFGMEVGFRLLDADPGARLGQDDLGNDGDDGAGAETHLVHGIDKVFVGVVNQAEGGGVLDGGGVEAAEVGDEFGDFGFDFAELFGFVVIEPMQDVGEVGDIGGEDVLAENGGGGGHFAQGIGPFQVGELLPDGLGQFQGDGESRGGVGAAEAQAERFEGLGIGLERGGLGGQLAAAAFAEGLQLAANRLEAARRAADGKNNEGTVAHDVGGGEFLGEALLGQRHLENKGGEKAGIDDVGRGQLGIAGEEAVDEFDAFSGSGNELEEEFHGFVGAFAMDDIGEAVAAGGDGAGDAGGGFGEEFEGVQAIGFAGVVAAHEEREVVQVVKLDALDAFEIADEHALET